MLYELARGSRAYRGKESDVPAVRREAEAKELEKSKSSRTRKIESGGGQIVGDPAMLEEIKKMGDVEKRKKKVLGK